MKINTEILARELAADKREDFDTIPHWKQVTYEVRATAIIRILRRIKERGDNES